MREAEWNAPPPHEGGIWGVGGRLDTDLILPFYLTSDLRREFVL